MKRLMVYLLCGFFLISVTGNVAAVEKKEKKPAKTQVTQKKKAPIKKSTKFVPKGKKRTIVAKKKKYDSFIDKNKNGIDDRQERLKKKTEAKVSKKEEKKK
jgi:hypothetical protein